MHVVVGPRNCGKTAVLQAFQARHPKVAYIDCRDYDVSSPRLFLVALLDRMLRRVPASLQEQVVQSLVSLWTFENIIQGRIGADAANAVGAQLELSVGDLSRLLRSLVLSPQRKGTADIVYRQIRCDFAVGLHGLLAGCRLVVPQGWLLRRFA
jgi:hypothetical protein